MWGGGCRRRQGSRCMNIKVFLYISLASSLADEDISWVSVCAGEDTEGGCGEAGSERESDIWTLVLVSIFCI